MVAPWLAAPSALEVLLAWTSPEGEAERVQMLTTDPAGRQQVAGTGLRIRDLGPTRTPETPLCSSRPTLRCERAPSRVRRFDGGNRRGM